MAPSLTLVFFLFLLLLLGVVSSGFPIGNDEAEPPRAPAKAFILASLLGDIKMSSCIMGFHMLSLLEEFPSDAVDMKVDAESCIAATSFFLVPRGVVSGVCAGVMGLCFVFLVPLDSPPPVVSLTTDMPPLVLGVLSCWR